MFKIAGVELVPHTDYEIAHINISGTDVEKLSPLTPETFAEPTTVHVDTVEEKNDAIVSWHTDSYPFVCVTMLSNCSYMIGGEPALRKGTGEVVKVRGPQMASEADFFL